MLTLKKPYVGRSNLDILRKIFMEPPFAPAIRIRDDIPDSLNRLILLMLEKFPDKRPSAAQVMNRLQQIKIQWSRMESPLEI
jgi:serine/threonine protein kinase